MMKYFKVNEFVCRCCRQLPEEEMENIEALAERVLDPVREKFGRSIKVNSGYRCPKHNAKVGGARDSQHMTGEAADIVAERKGYVNMTEWKQTNMEIAGLIIKNGRFDQLILENVGEHDLLPTWVHVSYKSRGGVNRGLVLKKVAGKQGYPALTTDEICKLLGCGFKKV